jgi:hypothetical protein
MRLLAAAIALVAMGAFAGISGPRQRLSDAVVQRGPMPMALGSVGAGGRATLWLPGGERAFEVEQVVRGRHATTRFGRVPGVGAATITLGPDGGFGQVTQGATLWLLEYRAGETLALRAGAGGLPFAPTDAADPAEFNGAQAEAPVAKASANTWRTVDLAGIYDPEFAARYPGTLAATRIEFLVALANQAFVDSDVGITLRLVHTALVPDPVHPSALQNIGAMYDATAGGTFGGLDLRGMREQYGADLVAFLRPHDLYAREVCGVARFPDDLRTGISVVMDGASAGSVCNPKVFAHEIGHNFGARHQWGADNTGSPGHALHRQGQFHTIMASLGSTKADRFLTLNYYSNPRIACGNLPCGEPDREDNATVMNGNAARVAGYLPSSPTVTAAAERPAPTLADSDADGVIDRVDAFPFDAERASDRDGDGAADDLDAFPDNSTESLDSDAGGQGDNADIDDDNDGVISRDDAFRLDPLETADADGDGHGDAGDAFDADPREQRDTDGDGVGDRADDDDDNDGLVDVAPFTAAAEGELLVVDAATSQMLRFGGADYAPLGMLLQLDPADVTVRSGMAGAASGELYFVSRNHFHYLDRLRGTEPELMLDVGSVLDTAFPLSPVVPPAGDVILAEMGTGRLIALYPAPARGAEPLTRAASTGKGHAALLADGRIVVLDSVSGILWRHTYPGGPALTYPFAQMTYGGLAAEYAAEDLATGPGGLLYWVDRRDGAVRSLDPVAFASGAFVLPDADAAAIDVSPDGILVVAQRSGGVRAYDAGDGTDLGLVIPASSAAQPVQLAWVPRIVDTDLPAIVPPTPPAPTADPVVTPAFNSARPPPPPCTTDCIQERVPAGTGSGGGGGAFGWELLLALLARRLPRKRQPV